MTTTQPPRFAETVLESFGAAPEFSDALIGDLAQEYARRAERYGEKSARMWYAREALLAVPHLLRNWLSRARLADARRLLNVAGLAYVSTLMVAMLASFVVFGFLDLFSLEPAWFLDPSVQVLGLYVASLIAPAVGGFFAASFEASRPMAAAAVLATAWAFVILAGAIVGALFMPELLSHPVVPSTWARLLLMPFVMIACMAGGAVRVWRSPAPAR